MDLKEVQAFLESDPDGQKLLQSLTDAKVTKGIETWRQNNVERLVTERVEQEIKKRYPPETEEAKRIRELEDRVAKSEQARIRESLRNKALSEATTKGLPTGFLDQLVGADEETTLANLEKLEAEWKASLEKSVEDRFKAGGRTPPKPDTPPKPAWTSEEIKRMSPAERTKNWPEIEKAMQEGRIKQ